MLVLTNPHRLRLHQLFDYSISIEANLAAGPLGPLHGDFGCEIFVNYTKI